MSKPNFSFGFTTRNIPLFLHHPHNSLPFAVVYRQQIHAGREMSNIQPHGLIARSLAKQYLACNIGYGNNILACCFKL